MRLVPPAGHPEEGQQVHRHPDSQRAAASRTCWRRQRPDGVHGRSHLEHVDYIVFKPSCAY